VARGDAMAWFVSSVWYCIGVFVRGFMRRGCRRSKKREERRGG